MSSISINENEVHIWQANLDLAVMHLGSLMNYLSDRELKCGKRLVHEIHQQRYFTSHAILRDILSRYVTVKPKNIAFEYSSHGKPSITTEQNPSNLRFNMSHSKNFAVYAITKNHEVGVDVEYMKQNPRAMAIAKRFYSDIEYQQLIALPVSEQHEGFYRVWTRKEAFIKGIGLGLSFPLKSFAVEVRSVDNSPLQMLESDDRHHHGWRIRTLESINQNFSAALAVHGQLDQITYWNWEFFSS